MISKVQWTEERRDRPIWVGDDKHEYTVKSGYSVLNNKGTMHTCQVFQLLWNLNIAPLAIVCAWRIFLDRLPTRFNLERRGMQLGNVQCPMCQEEVETTQHLFNTCKVAHKVWNHCKRWVGNVAVRHEFVFVHFQSFYLIGQRQSVNRVWKGMWLAIVSEIWNHKNKVVFKGRMVDAEKIFSLAKLKGWLWIRYKTSRTSFSFPD